MSPSRIDPDVDYKRLGELSQEFTQQWNRIQALYLDAAAGFALVCGHVLAEQKRARKYAEGQDPFSDEFLDSLQFSYSQIFLEPFTTSGIHKATQGEVKARTAPDGADFLALGQLCLVSFYDFWNEYLRREYVIAKGRLSRDEKNRNVIQDRLRQHASFDLWGDIRILRQLIVHCRGIASGDVTRCKTLRWFRPGDTIAITPLHMRTLLLELLEFRNQLFSEHFPPHYIEIPAAAFEAND